jgi:hypothetical protein
MNKEEVVKYFEGKDFTGHEPVKIPAGKIMDIPFFINIQFLRMQGKPSRESEAALQRLIELKNTLDASN